jgi:hypothetical protein
MNEFGFKNVRVVSQYSCRCRRFNTTTSTQEYVNYIVISQLYPENAKHNTVGLHSVLMSRRQLNAFENILEFFL